MSATVKVVVSFGRGSKVVLQKTSMWGRHAHTSKTMRWAKRRFRYPRSVRLANMSIADNQRTSQETLCFSQTSQNNPVD